MSDDVKETIVSELPSEHEMMPAVEEAVTEQVPAEVPEAKEETPAYTPDELEAMSKGWVPKDKFKGDLSEYKGAKAFLKDGDLYDFAKSAKKQIKELRDTVEHLKSRQQSNEEHKKRTELETLKIKQREAASIGDTDTVLSLTDRILELQTKPIVNPIDEMERRKNIEVNAFFERHPNLANPTDRESLELYQVAKKRDIELANLHPNLDPVLHFQEIERALAEHVNVKKPAPEPVSRVIVESATNTAPKSKKASINDLDPLQQRIVRSLQQADPKFDLDKYIDELKAIGVID